MTRPYKEGRKSKYSPDLKSKAVELRGKKGFSYAMVAEVLGVPFGTVKNWLEGVSVEAGKTLRRPYRKRILSFDQCEGKHSRKKCLIQLRGRLCEGCGLATWLGKPIPLELHHIDGSHDNESKENLMLCCPNCHAFTDTYKGKNMAKVKNGRVAQTEEARS